MDLDADLVALLHQFDKHFLGLAVAAGIGEGLLGNAVDGVFQDRRQAVELDLGLELDDGPSFSPFLIHEMSDGRDDPFLVEDRRTNAADQPSGLVVGLAEHRDCGMQGVGGLFGPGLPQMVEGIELHQCAGQLLRQSVMDLVGDQLPFVIAGLKKVPERSTFAFRGLLGPLAFGNVAEEADDAGAADDR